MKRLHVVGLVAGLGALAWGLVLLLGPAPERHEETSGARPGDAERQAPDGPKRPQVEILDGPSTRPDVAPEPQLGRSAPASQIESERRARDLREVLSKLQNAPVYVEGVDGPTRPRR